MKNKRGKELCSLSASHVCATTSAFAALGALCYFKFPWEKNLLNEFCLLLAGCSALVLDWEGSYAQGVRLAFYLGGKCLGERMEITVRVASR